MKELAVFAQGNQNKTTINNGSFNTDLAVLYSNARVYQLGGYGATNWISTIAPFDTAATSKLYALKTDESYVYLLNANQELVFFPVKRSGAGRVSAKYKTKGLEIPTEYVNRAYTLMTLLKNRASNNLCSLVWVLLKAEDDYWKNTGAADIWGLYVRIRLKLNCNLQYYDYSKLNNDEYFYGSDEEDEEDEEMENAPDEMEDVVPDDEVAHGPIAEKLVNSNCIVTRSKKELLVETELAPIFTMEAEPIVSNSNTPVFVVPRLIEVHDYAANTSHVERLFSLVPRLQVAAGKNFIEAFSEMQSTCELCGQMLSVDEANQRTHVLLVHGIDLRTRKKSNHNW